MNSPQTAARFSLKVGIMSIVLGLAAVGSAKIAFANVGVPGMPLPGNPDFTFTFDENGNSFFGNGQPVQWGVDGAGGIDFVLPVPVVPGSVIIHGNSDFGVDNPFAFSDLLTFSNIPLDTGFTGLLVYSSLADDGSPPDLADVPNLVAPATNFSTTEIGPEGANGFTWADPFAISATTYNGVSDGKVPEPSTIVLAALGGLALLAYRWRRTFQSQI
jgi:hypothetical protein